VTAMPDRFAMEVADTVIARLKRELPEVIGSGGGNPGGEHRSNGVKIQPRLLTCKQAAAYIGRSESALFHMVARREIPCVKHGRNLRFDRLELDKWIERDKV
jgi:excisionase family DNA binding protein